MPTVDMLVPKVREDADPSRVPGVVVHTRYNTPPFKRTHPITPFTAKEVRTTDGLNYIRKKEAPHEPE